MTAIAYPHRISGRHGEPTEYVEYRTSKGGVRYVAQKSGKDWFVYEVYPGRKGNVRTIGSNTSEEIAVIIAETFARGCVFRRRR